MTERLADVTARITGMHQLGAVVGAMRGIAAARAQQARAHLVAVDSHASAIAEAIGRAIALLPPGEMARARAATKPAIVLFCAEQGFAGAFSERIIDAVRAEIDNAALFAVGTRGIATLGERGIATVWTGPMPAQSGFIPKFADRIAEALYARIATGKIDRLDVVFTHWTVGRGAEILRRCLFPLDMALFPPRIDRSPPLLNLPPATLLAEFTAEHVHAQLCHAALHAFAAENEARMEAMAAAQREVQRRVGELESTQRLVRQEEITAEIVELTAGATSSLPGR